MLSFWRTRLDRRFTVVPRRVVADAGCVVLWLNEPPPRWVWVKVTAYQDMMWVAAALEGRGCSCAP